MSGLGEQNRSGGNALIGAMLFAAVMLFYFVTTSPFVDETAASITDPATEHSNALNQAVFLALTAGLWIYALASPLRREVGQPLALLAALAVWFLLVSVISDHPDIAIKRAVLSLLTCVNAGIVLLLPRSEPQFGRLITACSLLTLALACGGVVFLPQLSIHSAAEVREPMNAGLWRGHFPHKNAASVAMVLISFFGLYLFQSGRRTAGLALLVPAVVFLFQAGGKTATVSLPAVLLLTWIFQRWRWSRAPVVAGGVGAINALTLGAATSPAIRAGLADVGIDPTFTDRTDIWRLGIEAVAAKPVTGYGFQLFWQTEEMVYATAGAQSWAVQAFNGHNAFLDSAVTTGIPGLVLTLLFVLAVPLMDAARLDRATSSPHLTRLYLNIWLYGLFTGCVESIFFNSGSIIWFMMLVAMTGLRLQARARLVAAPATAPTPRLIDRIADALRDRGPSRQARRPVARARVARARSLRR